LLLIALKPQDLTSAQITSCATRLAPPQEGVLTRNGTIIHRYYYRVLYGYRPPARPDASTAAIQTQRPEKSSGSESSSRTRGPCACDSIKRCCVADGHGVTLHRKVLQVTYERPQPTCPIGLSNETDSRMHLRIVIDYSAHDSIVPSSWRSTHPLAAERFAQRGYLTFLLHSRC
jgi:hypothetical protein